MLNTSSIEGKGVKLLWKIISIDLSKHVRGNKENVVPCGTEFEAAGRRFIFTPGQRYASIARLRH